MPASRREHPGERREKSTIGCARGPRLLSPEHDQLMSQHKQLDVLGELPAPAPNEQPQHRQEYEVSEGEEHPPMLPEPVIPASRAGT